MTKPNIVVICGPTGIGKTAVGIELAREFASEIISADSMQVYKHMDIGTAKATLEEQAQVPHHLINIIEPDQPFDAAKFAKMGREKVMALHEQQTHSFVVGGTGFYIKALAHGLFSATPSDIRIRTRLKQEAATQGPDRFHRRLAECDPDTAERLHPNDIFRIVRALEVYELTGKPISECHHEHRFADQPFNLLKIGLHMERDALYERINQRVDLMVGAGLLDEVRHLLAMGYGEELKPMQSIGYRHMTDFVMGRLSWDEVLRTLKRDTRRYARRQMMWFKADPNIRWTSPERLGDVRAWIDQHFDLCG